MRFLSRQGQASACRSLLERMIRINKSKPDAITFSCVLSAYSKLAPDSNKERGVTRADVQNPAHSTNEQQNNIYQQEYRRTDRRRRSNAWAIQEASGVWQLMERQVKSVSRILIFKSWPITFSRNF